MDYDYNSDRDSPHKVGASYETVINMKKPFMANNARYSNKSYLEGTIFIDKNGNGKKEHDEDPLAGVGVRIGQNKVKTTQQGTFYLSEISPYRSHKLVYQLKP